MAQLNKQLSLLALRQDHSLGGGGGGGGGYPPSFLAPKKSEHTHIKVEIKIHLVDHSLRQ